MEPTISRHDSLVYLAAAYTICELWWPSEVVKSSDCLCAVLWFLLLKLSIDFHVVNSGWWTVLDWEHRVAKQPSGQKIPNSYSGQFFCHIINWKVHLHWNLASKISANLDLLPPVLPCHVENKVLMLSEFCVGLFINCVNFNTLTCPGAIPVSTLTV